MGFRKIFTLEERKRIQLLLTVGHNVSNIAEMMERSKNGIATEVRKNGGTKNYNAITAHDQSKIIHAEKSENMSKKMKGKPETFGMHKRIILLESQVRLLDDELSKIRKLIKNK